MSDHLSPAILKTVKRATTKPHPTDAPRPEQLTPPCHACNLPLLNMETVCPRCGAEGPIVNWPQIVGAFWLACATSALLLFTAAALWIRWQERKTARTRAELQRHVELDHAYEMGKLSGRVHRQMGGPQPSYWPVDDPLERATRLGIQDGWLDADREMREAEAWKADGIEDQIEQWKGAA